jgi:hypothetical protein
MAGPYLNLLKHVLMIKEGLAQGRFLSGPYFNSPYNISPNKKSPILMDRAF